MFKGMFYNWLTRRYQLVVRNEDDLAEKNTFYCSNAKVITLLLLLFITLLACSLVASSTILAKWWNPAYMEQENSKKIVGLSTSINDLMVQNDRQKKFIALLQNVIAGKEITPKELQETAALQKAVTQFPADTDPSLSQEEAEQWATADTLLRNEFQGNKPSLRNINDKPTGGLQVQELFLFTPVNGIITTPFRHKAEHYGVDIVAKENEPIKCVADGVVVFAACTLETGWVIAVQHSKNLTSIYKHNATLFKKVGSFVEAGDVIAIMGNSGELSTGPHLHFELWYEGNAVNPEHFINF